MTEMSVLESCGTPAVKMKVPSRPDRIGAARNNGVLKVGVISASDERCFSGSGVTQPCHVRREEITLTKKTNNNNNA